MSTLVDLGVFVGPRAALEREVFVSVVIVYIYGASKRTIASTLNCRSMLNHSRARMRACVSTLVDLVVCVGPRAALERVVFVSVVIVYIWSQ